MYIADEHNQRIRFVSMSTGIISTIAGDGSYGYNGDDIAATSASLAYPFRLAIDSSGSALTTKLVVLLLYGIIILTCHHCLYR